MRVLSADALAALDSGRFAVRHLVRVDVPGEDPFAIWDDAGSIDVDGLIYHGRPGRFTLNQTVSSQDLSIHNLEVTLSALDNEVAAMIDAKPWHQAPIIVQRAVIAIESPAVLHLMTEFAGVLDQMKWREVGAGAAEMKFICESASRELSRSGSRTRSDADQRTRSADDDYYKFAVSATTASIDWGRVPAKPPGGIAGFLSRVF